MANDGYAYYPYRSTTAFFYNSNGGNPGFLNLRPDHPLPQDLDLAFIPQPFTILSSSRGFILCRNLANGSYHLIDPLYPPIIGHKHIPDPPNPHPADTPAVVVATPQRDYKIVCAIDGDEEGYRFHTFDSCSGTWTVSCRFFSPDVTFRLLANTGVSWGGWACWLTEMFPQLVVMYNADTFITKITGFPNLASGHDPRMQLGRLDGHLGVVVVNNSVARVYRLIDVEAQWWEQVCSVEVRCYPAGIITNGHPRPMIVCRNIPQPLRFESFKVEVLFLVDGRLVLWESTDEDRETNRVVTAIQGPLENVQPVPLAFIDGSAVPYLISPIIPPAGVWPSDQPEGFTRHWI